LEWVEAEASYIRNAGSWSWHPPRKEYRAKALACDDRARTATLYDVRLQFEELARQWRSMAKQQERLFAEHGGKRD